LYGRPYSWFVPLSSIPVPGAITPGVALCGVDDSTHQGCAALIIKSNGF
jgi:hypothetical protein